MSANTAPRVLVMAGGTGGHVFPGLAAARALQAEGYSIEWLGTARGIESEQVPRAGIQLHCIGVQGLRGKGKLSLLLAPWRLSRALWQALGVLRRVQPDCVLGMGGFASGPGGLAAWLLRKPLVIHEQNAIPGLTNRLLARLAKRVLEAFPGAFKTVDGVRCTGNPVREDINRVLAPEARYANRQGPLRLLVVGGSLGAQVFNEVLPAVVATLEPGQRPQIWHQAGRGKLQGTEERYRALDVEARTETFIEDMNAAYSWADLVLCRAGALTVSELAAAGVPAVLVPLPHAVDDHQTANARFLADAGAGVLLPQVQLDAGSLAAVLRDLNDRARLQAMASKAKALARPEATAKVVEQIQECMREGK
ncbi:undecaprenyldiphospho-muramoylpentapeptide beta-N-acetylglucosaminyltransferase [Motiliproteus sp. SC1-56]|uniref:undecaprenyldiphospho-muramoylpentapeptide beta-N-acetylglucosaminyltransferase n=1 Tax=Motiliproteus sp. SC1-56 TaxID=2799565 RepID=UPI001A8C9146|nr:undecaprenyldiphospho-muramoylpentapeptide beta-N-acetylglucosaminyltransferase [Motiliproteus sp. SC1-56]